MIGQKFDEIDATKAHEYVSQSVPAWFKENKKFVGVPDDSSDDREDIEADHWQDGAGFLAPLPPKSDPTHKLLKEALENMFVVEDIIGDCLARRCNGVLGKDPQWSFERLEEQEADGQSEEETDAELDAINEHMSEWWKERNVHGILKKFVNAIGYGKRAFLRIYIPPGRFEGPDGTVAIRATSPDEALKHIFVEYLERDQAAVFVDKHSMSKVGIVVGERDFEDEPVDPTITQPKYQKWAEITYADGELTVFRITDEGGMEQAITFDLRGRLMLYEGVHPLYITVSVAQVAALVHLGNAYQVEVLPRSPVVRADAENLVS